MSPKSLRPKLPRRSIPDFKLLRSLYDSGYDRIVGVDEVGRGALAGPIIVATVELNQLIHGIMDSKQLSSRFRQQLAAKIHQSGAVIKFGWVSNLEIDQLGLSPALDLAYARALDGVRANLVLTDHYNLPTKHRFIRATRGDSLFYPVAAASIVAKVYRDQLMKVYSRFFPDYAWQQNVGYATSLHRGKINEIGPCVLHRQSFL